MASDNRRSFFLAVTYGLWGVISAVMGIPAAFYLLLPPKLRKTEDWADAGDVSKMAPNTPIEIVFRRNRHDGWRLISEKNTAWVVKKSDTDVIAYAPQCPHLGCAYHWEESKSNFLCPCHTSEFGLDGKVMSGPSARGLDRFPTKIENNRLRVGSGVIQGKEAGA